MLVMKACCMHAGASAYTHMPVLSLTRVRLRSAGKSLLMLQATGEGLRSHGARCWKLVVGNPWCWHFHKDSENWSSCITSYVETMQIP